MTNIAGLFELQAIDNASRDGLFLSVGFFVLALLAAFLLWMFPGPLARLAAGRSSQRIFESPIAAEELQWIAMSVLGAVFVMNGIVDLMFRIVGAAWTLPYELAGDVMMRSHAIDLIYFSVQIALGMALVLGSRGLAGTLRRLRRA